jgi:hypothetical protein
VKAFCTTHIGNTICNSSKDHRSASANALELACVNRIEL